MCWIANTQFLDHVESNPSKLYIKTKGERPRSLALHEVFICEFLENFGDYALVGQSLDKKSSMYAITYKMAILTMKSLFFIPLITIVPYDFPSLIVSILESFGETLAYFIKLFVWRMNLFINYEKPSYTEYQNRENIYMVIKVTIIDPIFNSLGMIAALILGQPISLIFSSISLAKGIYEGFFFYFGRNLSSSSEKKIIYGKTAFDVLEWISGNVATIFEHNN